MRDGLGMIESYRQRVPIRSHQEMRADLDAVYFGNWRRLCPSPPLYFSMTAGSTGSFKYIPVTAEYRRELGKGALVYYGALAACHPAMSRLKAQFLVGSAEGGRSPSGIPQGFASGFNYRNLPRPLRDRFILPYWVFTIPDQAERCYAAGRILAGRRDLGALCAISPVNLINLKCALDDNAERLFADLAAGTLTIRSRPSVPGNWRGRPEPGLAAELRRVWQCEGELPARQLFPSLQLLVCWQGGNMSYYLNELDEHFQQREHFEFPLSASEGLFAVPHRSNQAGGILAVTSHFLEFLPEAFAVGSPGRALRADQLEVGASYRLIVTNSGGLYRYDMEDIVRVTSFVDRTPVVTFVSKKDRQVSVANERLSERDVTVAMEAASRITGVWFQEFLFVPCSDRRYRVLLDGSAMARFSDAGRAGEVQPFAAELERQLRLAATGYDFERDDALLEPLELMVTAEGALKSWLGGRNGPQQLPNAQIKPMHLTRAFDLHRTFTSIATYAA
jgi:hypothetical protein